MTARPVATRSQWPAIRRHILERARWRCQACLRAGRLDVHHVIKRAQGGSDFDEDFLVALCRPCHDRTDTPFRRGRLVITAMGYGVFRFEHVWAADKWAVRGGARALCPSWANLPSIATHVWPMGRISPRRMPRVAARVQRPFASRGGRPRVLPVIRSVRGEPINKTLRHCPVDVFGN